jgi:uncharacterized protein (DUF433 family)
LACHVAALRAPENRIAIRYAPAGPGWSPEEIHFQHPHLSLAQIYSALAYYYENQAKLDGEIERERREAEHLRPRLSSPSLRQRLLDLQKFQ